MSGGTSIGVGGLIRQRHSPGGYGSSGDEVDLEDDACSRPRPFPPSTPAPPRRTWIELLGNFLWLASAAFILYFGDHHSNFIYILCHDNRIIRLPLYLGMIGIALNALIFIYTSILAWSVRRFDEKWGLKKLEITSITVLPFAIVSGIVSFCLFSFALWPIWSFLTLPLLFSLFMAFMVVIPYLTFGTFRPQYEEQLRTD
ncbi:PREDICTED: transmembrane protein 128-like [Lupinus angustifolius]|uniref:transmembrane protein 128-like n=1 Tax=Lupinus angustifolius TaxID=3871 RepID=UPI00092E96A6|nr:PREDICTED: transmembrane protein 128-like [Lupinus angustifolius]